MTTLAAATNENFAEISNVLIYSAMAVYTLAFFAYIAEWLFGNSSIGAPGVVFAPNPSNQFLYRTRETGNPTSALTLGEVAGFGKLFSSGARLAVFYSYAQNLPGAQATYSQGYARGPLP